MKILSIILVVVMIITLSGLVMLSQEYTPEMPAPSFCMAQGPEDSLLKPLVVVCTPDSGYDFCYENTYGAAYAKIQSTDWLGKSGYGYVDGAKRHYFIDEVYVNVKYNGDKLYKSTSSSWTSCSSSGCSASGISSGKQVIATAPSKVIPKVHFTAWDKFTSTSGQWWYSYVMFGWLSDTSGFYVIDCFDGTDCGENEYCDKSGSWDTWVCAIDECLLMPDPEDICIGYDLWSQKCVYGEYIQDKLIESNSVQCDCVLPPETIDDICIGYDLWSQKQAEPCVNVYVKDELLEEKSSECGYVCSEGETQIFTCTDGSEIITETCINNEFVHTYGVDEFYGQSCPLSWINLRVILESYLEEIKVFWEGILLLEEET